MLTDTQNDEVLKALVGNVEWIIGRQFFNDNLRLVFRVNGELRGLEIYERAPTRYGHRSVERVGPTSIFVDPMNRKDILAMATYHKAALTDSELAEWDAICQAEAAKRQKMDDDEARRKEEMERRQFEELQKKYGK